MKKHFMSMIFIIIMCIFISSICGFLGGVICYFLSANMTITLVLNGLTAIGTVLAVFVSIWLSYRSSQRERMYRKQNILLELKNLFFVLNEIKMDTHASLKSIEVLDDKVENENENEKLKEIQCFLLTMFKKDKAQGVTDAVNKIKIGIDYLAEPKIINSFKQVELNWGELLAKIMLLDPELKKILEKESIEILEKYEYVSSIKENMEKFYNSINEFEEIKKQIIKI